MSLKIIILSSSLYKIGPSAFRECKRLKVVTFSEGLKSIEKRAFYKCPSLESIKLPSTLSKIGVEAFAGCSSLKDVALGEGLQCIGRKAFRACHLLADFRYPCVIKFLKGICIENQQEIADNFNKIPEVTMTAGGKVTISIAIATGGYKDRKIRK